MQSCITDQAQLPVLPIQERTKGCVLTAHGNVAVQASFLVAELPDGAKFGKYCQNHCFPKNLPTVLALFLCQNFAIL